MGRNIEKYMLVLIIFISCIQQAVLTCATKSSKAYIKRSCITTTYPRVCYQSLSIYAAKIKSNPLKLTKTALSVTLKSARNANKVVSQLLKQKGLTRVEANIVKDCIENIRDSIDEIQQSLKALGHLGDSKTQIADIKTWVSAAVTDETTCMDEFDGVRVRPSVKNRIRKSVLSIAKLTSNALALINKLP